MTTDKRFQSQFLLATDAITAISAELGDPMMDFSEVGHIEGRLPYIKLIKMISDMAMQIENPGIQGSRNHRGISTELRTEIDHYIYESQFSAELAEILEALIDGVDLIWEEA